eukprot:TRINITY_DN79590_c0_g1_i1.p1 TRINITY_DN79590_c0_g1~~TRINITY_DN79590_c0_g1_i1.p1  ORF type:complete len:583 (+),score=59.03 TRINITY_DN79590_c0_g1_i1:250-1749(+)
MAAIPLLRELDGSMSRIPRLWRDDPDVGQALASRCTPQIALRETLLLFLRLLGQTVPPERDPLAETRSRNLGRVLGSLHVASLLRHGWPLFAMLAMARLNTWRSHRLYTGAQVQPVDVSRSLELALEVLQLHNVPIELGSSIVETIYANPEARRTLWKRVATPSSASLSFSASEIFPSIWRRVAAWLAEAPSDVPPVVFMSMFWGSMGDETWVSRYLQRAMEVGIQRFAFITPAPQLMDDCLAVSDHWLSMGDTYRRLLCIRSFAPFSRPYDVNNYAKFVILPVLLSLGVNYAWLDIDIYVAQDPSQRLLELAYGSTRWDILTTDHFDETCLNHGVIFVTASDRTLLWTLRYQRWMHENPFGHDQNGWDACLSHSIQNEPLVPKEPNVSFSVLDTAYEFLTLTGWAGDEEDLSRVQLLHLTRTTPIDIREKRERFQAMMQATVPPEGLRRADASKERETLLAALLPLRRPVPEKRPCYEGVHVAVEGLIDDGSYWQLFE